MARKYVNPAKSAPPVDDKLLDEARAKAEVTAARLREAERGDPLAPSWPAEYEAATAAARATSRRVEALEQLRAAQLERGGQRAAAVKSAQKDLAAKGTALATSRDAVAAAAAEHLRSLAALAAATEGHNALLSQSRARLAGAGLAGALTTWSTRAPSTLRASWTGRACGRAVPTGLPYPQPGWSLTACGRFSAPRALCIRWPRSAGMPGGPTRSRPGRTT